MADFAALKGALIASAQEVHEIFIDTIEEPARRLDGELGEGARKP